MKRLCIVTDAWLPQTNGVVTTLSAAVEHLPDLGYDVQVVHPGRFSTLPLPSYPDIHVARNPWKVTTMIERCRPDAVHIATEGPLGLWTRRLLRWFHAPAAAAMCITESHRRELAQWGSPTWWYGVEAWIRIGSARCRSRDAPHEPDRACYTWEGQR